MLAPAATESPTAVFLGRDLSWLEFNRQVLHEALDTRTPLLWSRNNPVFAELGEETLERKWPWWVGPRGVG
jgi:hypothetical protein